MDFYSSDIIYKYLLRHHVVKTWTGNDSQADADVISMLVLVTIELIIMNKFLISLSYEIHYSIKEIQNW